MRCTISLQFLWLCLLTLAAQPSLAQNIFNLTESTGNETIVVLADNSTQPPDLNTNTTIPPEIDTNTTLSPADTNTTTLPPLSNVTNNTTLPPLGNATNNATLPPDGNATNITTMAPTSFPTAAPIPGGPATRQVINTMFVVSNLNDIRIGSTVNNSGLQAAWPTFVAEVVADTLSKRTFQSGPVGRRRQLRNIEQQKNKHESQQQRQQQRRRLSVDIEPGTEYIYDITLLNPCPTDVGPVHEDATCHEARGRYTLLLRDDDEINPAAVENEFGMATAQAVMDGKLDDTMKEIAPLSPLFIGVVAPPNSDDGFPIWAIILIVLVALLICICCVAATYRYFVAKDRDDEDGGGKTNDEEGFGDSFLIPKSTKPQTEVDDTDAEEGGPKGVDVESFFDDGTPVVITGVEQDSPAVDTDGGETDEEEFNEDDHDDDDDDDDDDEPDEVSGSAVPATRNDANDPPLVEGGNDAEECEELEESRNNDEQEEEEEDDGSEWDDEDKQ